MFYSKYCRTCYVDKLWVCQRTENQLYILLSFLCYEFYLSYYISTLALYIWSCLLFMLSIYKACVSICKWWISDFRPLLNIMSFYTDWNLLVPDIFRSTWTSDLYHLTSIFGHRILILARKIWMISLVDLLSLLGLAWEIYMGR